MPKNEREAIEQEDEIFGFLKQSHISEKNVSRLNILASSESLRIAELADIDSRLLMLNHTRNAA
jgi:hypothetical protein